MAANISVVLPTFNRAHILAKAIDSVLNQSYHDFELIIADDCSTDDTHFLVSSYTDKRIRYVRTPCNSNAGATRNFGAFYATSPYLAFCDDDTIWAHDKLERQTAYISAYPNVSLVFHSFLDITPEKGGGAQTILEPNQERLSSLSTHIFHDLLFGPLIPAPAILMRTEAFRHVGGFLETLKSHEDYEFSLRVAKDYEIGHLPEPLLASYHVDRGVNTNHHEILRTGFYILNLYRDIISAHADMEATQLERLFYYALIGNDGQYFFDQLAFYVIAVNHRNLYYEYEKKYNDIRSQLQEGNKIKDGVPNG